MTATIQGRMMTVTEIQAIDGPLAADLIARGWEPAFYTLAGKRGGSLVCLRNAKTGEFYPV